MKLIILVIMLIGASSTAQATGQSNRIYIDSNSQNMSCMITASKKFDIPYYIFYAIAKQEGGWIGLHQGNWHKGSITSYDLGLFQINTRWVKYLKPYFKDISNDALSNNGCLNIYTAAMIFNYERVSHASGDIWKTVGHYHSKNKVLQDKYVRLVKNRYNQLLRQHQYNMKKDRS